MGDVREALKPWNNKRIAVRGQLDDFGHWVHNHRDSLRACIVSPEVDGVVVAHHVWVTNCRHWGQFRDHIGETVKFHATVSSYVERKDRKTNYCLTNADLPEFIHAPALRIPDPPSAVVDDDDGPEVRREIEVALKPPEQVVLVPAAVDPTAMLRQARKFIKACGKADRAKDVATFLKDNPVDPVQLLLWIDALQEE